MGKWGVPLVTVHAYVCCVLRVLFGGACELYGWMPRALRDVLEDNV